MPPWKITGHRMYVTHYKLIINSSSMKRVVSNIYSHDSVEISTCQLSFQGKTHYSVHHTRCLLLQYILSFTASTVQQHETTYHGSATSIRFRNPSPSTILTHLRCLTINSAIDSVSFIALTELWGSFLTFQAPWL